MQVIDKDFYMNLPYDLSGARSKNRFRNEILWGLEKIFEIYKSENDFTVIFDYVCDIEIHIQNTFEFYQVKTHNNATPYTLQNILKTNKTGDSVLGKLYLLKQYSGEDKPSIKVAIVSNVAFKDSNNKLHSTCGELDFSNLDPQCKQFIENKIKKELNVNDGVDLEGVCYIYTSMDLFHPDNSLLGQTVNFFITAIGEEPKKPAALYHLLSDTIAQKASYELISTDYDSLVLNKGITRTELNLMLNRYTLKTDESIKKVVNIIDSFANYKQRVGLKSALTKMTSSLSKSKPLQNIETTLAGYIKNNLDVLNGDTIDIAEVLYKHFENEFSIEYNKNEIISFILLVMMRIEEGVYDEFDC